MPIENTTCHIARIIGWSKIKLDIRVHALKNYEVTFYKDKWILPDYFWRLMGSLISQTCLTLTLWIFCVRYAILRDTLL